VSAERLLWCVRDVEKAIFILLRLIQSTDGLRHWRYCSFIDDEIQCMIASQRQAVSITDIHTVTDISGTASGGSCGAWVHPKTLGKIVRCYRNWCTFFKLANEKQNKLCTLEVHPFCVGISDYWWFMKWCLFY